MNEALQAQIPRKVVSVHWAFPSWGRRASASGVVLGAWTCRVHRVSEVSRAVAEKPSFTRVSEAWTLVRGLASGAGLAVGQAQLLLAWLRWAGGQGCLCCRHSRVWLRALEGDSSFTREAQSRTGCHRPLQKWLSWVRRGFVWTAFLRGNSDVCHDHSFGSERCLYHRVLRRRLLGRWKGEG